MILLLTLWACKDEAEVHDSAPSPWDDGEAMILIEDGQPALYGSVDGGPSLLWALDTGADRMYLDQDLADGQRTVTAELTLGSLTLPDQALRALDLSEAEAALGVDLGGLAGEPLFEGRYVTLDYRASRVHFGDEPLPGAPRAGGEGPTVFDTETQGGLPILTLDLGGPTRLIADTGSGVTVLTQSRFDAIDDGGLPRLQGYVWSTSYGSDAAFVTRLPAEGVPGLSVGGTWAVVVPDENHLSPLLAQAHIDAEGFLGYPFYRRGALGVDVDQAQLSFWPYEAPDSLEAEEWRRVGVELAAREGELRVEMVFSPSDAEDQGVQVGDRLLRIDGQAPADLAAARRALRGEGVRALELEREGAPLSLSVAVEDLLPAL